jgi:hypothetical protein
MTAWMAGKVATAQRFDLLLTKSLYALASPHRLFNKHKILVFNPFSRNPHA